MIKATDFQLYKIYLIQSRGTLDFLEFVIYTDPSYILTETISSSTQGEKSTITLDTLAEEVPLENLPLYLHHEWKTPLFDYLISGVFNGLTNEEVLYSLKQKDSWNPRARDVHIIELDLCSLWNKDDNRELP